MNTNCPKCDDPACTVAALYQVMLDTPDDDANFDAAFDSWDFADSQCEARAVDWRARAQVAEAKIAKVRYLTKWWLAKKDLHTDTALAIGDFGTDVMEWIGEP
jgi:hypothetical protein